MALKLIATLLGNPETSFGRSVRIYRDTECEEFCVKLFVNGVHCTPSDYFTDDKDDAHGTGLLMLEPTLR